jgi:hypothetical protein
VNPRSTTPNATARPDQGVQEAVVRRAISGVACAAAAVVSVLVSSVACGGGTPSADAPDAPPIARIHRAQCGKCHVRVEPGERTREQLEAAFPRHHRRVRLTDDEWAQMVEYLASTKR